MKTSSQILLVFILSTLFTFCSSDDKSNDAVTQVVQDPIIESSKFTTNMVPHDPNIPVKKHNYIGSISDNKKQNITREVFIEGVSQGPPIDAQIYEYAGDGRLTYHNKDLPQNDDIEEFAYDLDGNVVGVTWTNYGSSQYYRFVHPSSSITYFERISLPYNDPNTVLGFRYILEFDDNDNVIKAGRDSNFDGNMDYENIYTYDSNNNMASAQITNGDIITFSYSSVINTEQYLEDKTYGKKLLRIRYAEKYGYNNVERFLKDLTGNSYNLTLQATTEAEYEVLDNNFYNKKTEIGENHVGTGIDTITEEYYFL